MRLASIAIAAVLSLVVFLIGAATAAAEARPAPVNPRTALDQHNNSQECGTPVAGIALCLRSSGSLELMLEIRNTGNQDEVLNLGIMLGRKQYPKAIDLTLTDAAGTKHHANWGEPPIIGGRIDPLVLPLPGGASMTLPVHLSKYVWLVSGQVEDFKPDPAQHYIAQAEFAGKGVSRAERNLDMRGIALMPYWTGVVTSNPVTIEPQPHVHRNQR